MKITKLLSTGLIALAIVATSDLASAGSATPDSIIVMPARKRVVQLAFQMSRCKDIGMVTYNNSPTLSAPLIHVWNGQEWVQISLDDYVQGRFMSGEPKHVFLLGDSTTLPLRMMDEVSWYKDLNRLTSLDTATLINHIGKTLKFSSRQWKWISGENGLKIKDENAERRRYGRWGGPGKEQDLRPNKLESIELPPTAPIIEPTRSDLEKADMMMKVSDLPENEVPKNPVTTTDTKIEAKPATPPPAPVVEMPAPVVEPPVKPEAPAAPVQPVPAKAIDPTSK